MSLVGLLLLLSERLYAHLPSDDVDLVQDMVDLLVRGFGAARSGPDHLNRLLLWLVELIQLRLL